MGDRGAVLYIMMLFLVMFIALATVAVDLAALGSRGQELQNTSDAAALAGVVEYQQQVVAGATPEDAEAAARQVVEDVLRQNGIDPDDPTIILDLDLSDDGTELTVVIGDADPDQFLPNDFLTETIKDDDQGVARSATASFIACEKDCPITAKIPESINAIRARGLGDGYKPIPVGNRLYAINHNSQNRQIVCVDRSTQARCWSGTESRDAYSSSVGFFDRNPEMPHTAVINDQIYWTVTDDEGLRMFCFQTAVDPEFDRPCQESVTLNSSLTRFDSGDPANDLTHVKDENRGGGTFTVLGQRVYAFSDDHRIHCHNPATGSVCSGYANGGNPTGLAAFPAASPEDGNHGSSIDRVVDEATGRVYATLHLPFAEPPVNCESPLADPAGQRVIVVNEETGRLLYTDAPDFVFTGLRDDVGTISQSWWDVENIGADTISFQSALTSEYLDATPFVGTSVSADQDDEWNAIIDGDAYFIDSEFNGGALFDDDGTLLEEEPPTSPKSRWNFFPWQCGDSTFTPESAPDYYTRGTWLHCYDTGAVTGNPGPCEAPGGVPWQVSGAAGAATGDASPLHADGTRFSGRLWFYYSSGPNPVKEGVCSSGYGTWFAPGSNLDRSTIEITCVDLATGAFDSTMSSDMSPLRDEIRLNTSSTRPGAWGDPHWNDFSNRLFYPSERTGGRGDDGVGAVMCFDFDSGICDTRLGEIELDTPDGLPPITQITQDYGFFSDGDCVFALGHLSYFWAFKASEPGERCDPEPSKTTIFKCECADGAVARWGELDFSDIDLDLFDSFGIRITTDQGVDSLSIFPGDGSYFSLKPGGGDPRIPLDDLPIPDAATSIVLEIKVTGISEELLAEVGEFELRFTQRPRLVD